MDKKDKWEYSKLDLQNDGWRSDIRLKLEEIGEQNIKKIKTRRAGYVDEECYAVLHDGKQIKLV